GQSKLQLSWNIPCEIVNEGSGNRDEPGGGDHTRLPIGIVRGSLKPTRIDQRNPGKRVSGMSGRNLTLSISNQLSSPQTAMAMPSHMSQRGMRRVSPAVTATPAMKMPNGTENPGPPMANNIR